MRRTEMTVPMKKTEALNLRPAVQYVRSLAALHPHPRTYYIRLHVLSWLAGHSVRAYIKIFLCVTAGTISRVL